MQFKLTNQDSKNSFKQYVNYIFTKYSKSGKNFFLDFKEGSEIRSLQQNAYYWSVVIPIAQQIYKDIEGKTFDTELTHEQLKLAFGTQVFSEDKYWYYVYSNKIISELEFESLDYIDRNKCERRFIMPSTAKMTKKQFMSYLELIQEWASFLDYEIPDPN